MSLQILLKHLASRVITGAFFPVTSRSSAGAGAASIYDEAGVTMHLRSLLLLLCLGDGALRGSTEPAVDADRDGVPDAFEDALLLRFLPAFHVSAHDCDAVPAEFERGAREPRSQAKNGTIYGQVLPLPRGDAKQSWLEVHYFHLWSRDCGPPPHSLDIEMVAVLLRGTPGEWRPDRWRAVSWYAAAHEDTLCDLSHGAAAAALSATEHGPDVWVSRDKHASYLDRRLCSRGCGKDVCETSLPLPVPQVINLGEPDALLAGSDWVDSPAWRLRSKMRSYFTESLMTRMPVDDQVRLLPARDVVKGARSTIKVAAHTYYALESANAHTGTSITAGAEGTTAALHAGIAFADKSVQHAGGSVKTAVTATGTALKKALRKAVGQPTRTDP